MITRETFSEVIRFGIVGIISTILHYGVYWVLQNWIEVNIAYTTGYVLSFLVNYWPSRCVYEYSVRLHLCEFFCAD